MASSGGDDAELGARVQSGDDDAFGLLYERYVGRLYDFVARIVREPAAAEDVVQSTFIRAWERRETLREAAKVKSWLFAVAHNLAINHVEQRRPAEPVEERWDLPDPRPGPEGQVMANDAAQLVWDAAASLEPRQYAVLDLSVRQQLTTPEIAGVMGLPSAHTAVLVNRAKEALGNAVRYLLVARRRDHCERLAALVPAGVRALRPEMRSAVDYHMRRCDNCQEMAGRLTLPVELFGGLAPLPVPAELLQWRGWSAGTATAPASGGYGTRQPRRRPRRGSRMPMAIAGTIGVIAVGAAGVLVARQLGGGPRSHNQQPGAPTTAAPSRTPSAIVTSFAPVPLSVLASGPTTYLSAACPEVSSCYIVGRSGGGGAVTMTGDGGKTWSTSYVTGMKEIDAISCPSQATCFAGGFTLAGAPAIEITRDGARSWSSRTVPANTLFTAMRCPTAQACLAVGGQVLPNYATSVIGTTDGGATWVSRPTPRDKSGSPGYVVAVDCIDAAHCWAAGSSVWFTSDLGASWRTIEPPNCSLTSTQACTLWSLFFDVDFVSPTEGWVVGGDQCGGFNRPDCPSAVAHTVDGGKTWTFQDTTTIPFAEQISCWARTCVLVGDGGSHAVVLTARDGGAWRPLLTVGGELWGLACDPIGSVCVAGGGNQDVPVVLTEHGG